jgi:MraZ protein
MYYGESSASVDDKGRLNVPMQFRAIMETNDHDVWYLTRGFDGAIFAFEKSQWAQLLTQTGGSSPLDPRMLDFRRLFLGSVAKVKRDGQGRLGIPAHLREHAGIDREAVVIGVEDHLELWGPEGWRAFHARQAEQYKLMAAELFSAKRGAAATAGDVQGA